VTSFSLQENNYKNASFCKIPLAHTLHGSVAMQLRWDGRFYSITDCRGEKLLKSVNRNQRYCN